MLIYKKIFFKNFIIYKKEEKMDAVIKNIEEKILKKLVKKFLDSFK